MTLFFKSYFLLNFFIFSVPVHANTYPILSSKEQLTAHAVWSLHNEKSIIGTGFFIAPNRIVTNFHVIEGLLPYNELTNIKIRQENKSSWVKSDIKITKIIALSAISDLAILETNKSTDTYLKININLDKETQDLFSIGYPNRHFSKTSQIGPLQIISNQLIFTINNSNMRGASGSPILDSNNQVVGVVTSGFFNLMRSTQAEQLNRLIKKTIGFYCEDYNERTCINKTIELAIEKANQGDVDAQNQLGGFYFYGVGGVNQDLKKGFYWKQQAAMQGLATAQQQLGVMYASGYGIKQNTNMAAYWFQESADQGYAAAQYNLGKMLFYGKGGKQDKRKAVEWLLKAAKQGLAPAQQLLDQIHIP